MFTAIDIYKDEIITLFKGEILDNNEAHKRAKQNNDRYFINLLNGTIMDSMHTDCFAKYANDTKGSINTKFKNNAEITLDDNHNVCIKATKKIKSDQEIFCGYGKAYWKKHQE
ncbi:SET domain-containing protein-lysine N-methyltransferase [Olleya sp. ITB9]|uniref:SET domain-containing protein-lysine N-methyltransferase n=1 Tax=Olleya sp. ITB9 TaxID=1715648 RepID=UPI0009EBE6E3|nr:SET domain-containing protein-lysine N-methyltransferase [Olleya sp. ITB9]